MRVCICGTQVPFATGGAEIHVESLRAELDRRGFDVTVVTLPYSISTRLELLQTSLAWRLLSLRPGDGGAEIDLMIATRFPSYMIRHPNKVVWLIHQLRQAYDLLGTRYSDFTNSPDDRKVLEMVRTMDRRTLGEARALFANSRNTANRLKKFNGLDALPLYPPPSLDGSYRCEAFGDYIFGVGRLDQLKRFDLLVRSMRHTGPEVRCLIAGEGPEREKLQALIDESGLAERVQLLGHISDEELLDRYANAFAVYFAPYDEDYGYITIEAFKSGKPVITAHDSGGVLEWVADGHNGYVCPSGSPREFGQRIDALFADRDAARRFGANGAETVKTIN